MSVHHLLSGGLLLLSILIASCSSYDDGGSEPDTDSDGVVDSADNCPDIDNEDQTDADGDGVGDACDACQTVSLIDIWPGGASGDPSGLIMLNGRAYFQANDGVHGEELWRHDPATGAELVLNLAPDSGGSVPGSLTAIDGVLYFQANDGVFGRELWAFDPAEPLAQAMLVADINPGRGSSYPQPFAAEGKLYFSSNDGEGNFGLWAFDSTAGPALLTDFEPAQDFDSVSEPTIMDDLLYFRERVDGLSDLWFLNLADGSVTRVDIHTDPNEGSSPREITALSGKLYFTADDGVHGRELWVHDPASGATRLSDINPGEERSISGSLTVVEGALYFWARNASKNLELWEYSPSTGLRLLAGISPDGIWRDDLQVLDGVLYFLGDDGIQGNRLWRYDPVLDTGPIAVSTSGRSDAASMLRSVDSLTIIDGRLYLTAEEDDIGYTLWTYDPDTSFELVTTLFANSHPRHHPRWLDGVDGLIYFVANDGVHGTELWVYDSTCSQADP